MSGGSSDRPSAGSLLRALRDRLRGTRAVAPPPATSPLAPEGGAPAPERVGPYRVVRQIGQGGMGVVFEAHDERLERPVAIGLRAAPHDHDRMTMVIAGGVVSTLVSKSAFKARALEFFREVERTGREVVVTDKGRPVLKVVPYSRDPAEALKALRGSVLRYEEPTEPVGVGDWESLR